MMHGNVSINGPLGRKLHAQGYRSPQVNPPLRLRLVQSRQELEAAERTRLAVEQAEAAAKERAEREIKEATRRFHEQLVLEAKRTETQRRERNKRIAVAIRMLVAARHGIPVACLNAPDRHHVFVLARQEAFYLIHFETTMGWTRMGKMFGRDHTTCLHGAKRHAERNGLPAPRAVVAI